MIRPVRFKDETCPLDPCPGWYKPDLPRDDPRAGQLAPCVCILRAEARAIRAALPPEIRRMTFETFRVSDTDRGAVELVRSFATDPWGQCFDDGREWWFLTLLGAYQVGKTHLAAAIDNALLERGEPARFESIPDLLDELRGGFGNGQYEARLDTALNAQVLVLDDLGAERSGRPGAGYAVSFAEEKLYQIVNHRITHQLPTVVTSNLRLGEMPARIAGRLRRHAVVSIKSLPNRAAA